jgi:hypothetical protein
MFHLGQRYREQIGGSDEELEMPSGNEVNNTKLLRWVKAVAADRFGNMSGTLGHAPRRMGLRLYVISDLPMVPNLEEPNADQKANGGGANRRCTKAILEAQQGRNGVTVDEDYQPRQKSIFSEAKRNCRDSNESRENPKEPRSQGHPTGFG